VTRPNLPSNLSVLPVPNKPNKYKIKAEASCNITVLYAGTGQEIHDGNTTVEEHERSHVDYSQSNFSQVISLYKSYNDMVVCGEKCANAIYRFLSTYRDWKETYNFYQNKQFDCDTYSPGSQQERVCKEAKNLEKQYMDKEKENNRDREVMEKACKP